MNKHEVAHVLEDIGVLLGFKNENPFKIRAYHNAARSIENLDEDLELVVKEKRLKDLPGIGERIAKKVETLVRTGRLPYYEKLKKSLPKGLVDLLQVPGLGGKKIKILYEKLKIKTLDDLTKACEKGKVAKLRGFGPKTQSNILNGIAKLKSYGKRLIWSSAEKIADPILEKLKKLKWVKKVEIAGSFRRKLEIVGDLDFVASSSNPQAVMKWFASQPWIETVISKGPTKTSVRLTSGIQVDLRVVPEKQFGYALLYFTGSKNHNIRIRRIANEKGFSLSEYALESIKGRRVSLPASLRKRQVSEKDIYEALGLPEFPPEIREDMGEIEAAKKGKIPVLVEEKDLKGVFHCHTTDSDGHNTLEEMVNAAESFGWEYIGISDHSKSSFQANGMNEKQLMDQVKRIQKLNQSKKFSIHIFSGLECDILKNGHLDFGNDILKELDFVIVSVHRSFSMDEKSMTSRLIKAIEHPLTTMLGHVTGRLLLKRDPYKVDLQKVIDACIANGKVMELNAQPLRLEMDWRFWHAAADKGLKCCINPDAHRVSDLKFCRFGINVARKGWLEKKNVINTLPFVKIKELIKR
jgi:DNA polymerase (family 10)